MVNRLSLIWVAGLLILAFGHVEPLLAAPSTSASKSPKQSEPASLTDCFFVAPSAVCMNETGQIILWRDVFSGAQEPTKIELKSGSEVLIARNFQCKQKSRPYCIIIADSRLNEGDMIGGVFKVDLISHTSRAISRGNYQFRPSFEDEIVLSRVSNGSVVFEAFSERYDGLVLSATLLPSETATWQLPFHLTTADRPKSALFAYNPSYNSARVIMAGEADQNVYAPDTQRFLSEWLSTGPARANYTWAGVPDFARTRTIPEKPLLDRIYARRDGDGEVEIVRERLELDLDDTIIQSRVPQIDANGDVYFVIGSPQGTAPAILCATSSGRQSLKVLSPPALERRLSIVSSSLVEGFTMRAELPGNIISYHYVLPSKVSVGEVRKCSDTKLESHAIVSFQEVAKEEAETESVFNILRAPVQGGSTLPNSALIITKSRVVAPTGIVIDIYGAAGGTPRAPHWAIKPFNPALDQNWVAHAILPGDGDLGRAFARFAQSPHRARSVQALNRLIEELIMTYPSLSGNVTLRTASGGASTALIALLTRPDLYSGTYIISGAYDLRVVMENPEINGFHSAIDQIELDQALAAAPQFCHGSKFFVFHASDDVRVGALQADRFFQKLEAKQCLLNKVVTKAGGHDMSPRLMSANDAQIFLEILRDRASQPLFKDLELARRVYNQAP